MIKGAEAAHPDSCWNRAAEDEMVFVLIGRDKAAPAAIRAWCAERIRLGKNSPDDVQILTAKAIADAMESGESQ